LIKEQKPLERHHDIEYQWITTKTDVFLYKNVVLKAPAQRYTCTSYRSTLGLCLYYIKMYSSISRTKGSFTGKSDFEISKCILETAKKELLSQNSATTFNKTTLTKGFFPQSAHQYWVSCPESRGSLAYCKIGLWNGATTLSITVNKTQHSALRPSAQDIVLLCWVPLMLNDIYAQCHSQAFLCWIYPINPISGLYYKPMTIVNDDSRVITMLETSLTDKARVVFYDHHMFIV
jgi:hypothetical protein